MEIGGYDPNKLFRNVQVTEEHQLLVSTASAGVIANQYDTIYQSDVDWDASDFTGWEGNPEDLFGKLSESKGVYNETANNPKSFTLVFKRTVRAKAFGIGTALGNFSNIKVNVFGSGGQLRGILDLSEDPYKDTSLVYSQEQYEFNSLTVEFYTADRVDVTNIFLKDDYSDIKQDYVLKYGINEDVDTAVEETAWTIGDLYVFTTIAQPYFISSSDATDTQIVKGEALVLINGRKHQYNWEVQLQGQTKVQIPVVGNYLCVANNRAAKNGGAAFAGDIYIYEDTTIISGVPTDLSKVRSHIVAGRNQTEQAVYTVPEFLADGRHVAFANLYEWTAAVVRNRATSGIFDLYITDSDAVPIIKGSSPCSENFISGKNYGRDTPLRVAPGSDVYINVRELTQNNCAVTADFIIDPIPL